MTKSSPTRKVAGGSSRSPRPAKGSASKSSPTRKSAGKNGDPPRPTDSDNGRTTETTRGSILEESTEVQTRQLDSPFEPALGVEFEFLIAKYYEGDRPKHLDQEYGIQLVHDLLQQPLTFTCDKCHQSQNFELPLNDMISGDPVGERARTSKASSDFGKWTVMAEGQVGLTRNEEKILKKAGAKLREALHVTAVELVTRKLNAATSHRTKLGCPADDSGGWHSITYREEVRVVLQALQNAFNTPAGCTGNRQDTRMFISDSCGLHVHIGNGRRGLTLQTTKNTFYLATAFERTIDSMTATSRIGGTYLAQEYIDEEATACEARDFPTSYPIEDEEIYNNPLSTYFLASARRARARSSDFNTFIPDRSRFPESELTAAQMDVIGSSFEPADFLRLIEMAPSIYALQSMIKPDPHRAALNPENLDAYDRPRNDRIKMTMEFRQQKAFIDADEVLPWVDFVVSVVKFAARSHGPAILEHCLTECANANPNIEPFLTGLGVSPATIDFYLQRADQRNDAMVAVAQTEGARTDAFGPGHPLTNFAKVMTRARCDTHRAANIQKKIRQKFRSGGYGRYPRKYLDAMEFNPESEEQRLDKEVLVPKYEPVEEDLDDPPFPDDE